MDEIPSVTQDDVDHLIGFIQSVAKKSRCDGVVIGLSGGLDSAVVTKLCVDALGAGKVLNIFMPSRVTPAEDYKVTSELSKGWGTEYKIIDVQPAVDSLTAVLLSSNETPLDRGNISARCRMIVLYNQARKRHYLVMGTSNQSELMMGYFTKFGDGACDATPLANMYKTQVRELAKLIGIPQDIIAKPPTAGLWQGQTDEDEMNITYVNLDKILYGFEMERSDKEISAAYDIPLKKIAEIRERVRSTEHKRLPAERPGELE
jgi:NAD+ synthase